MGFLDFLYRKPTIDQFAKLVMAEIRKAGLTGDLTYDPENARIIYGSGDGGGKLNLVNFYNDFLKIPRGKRNQQVAAVVQSVFVPHTLPEDFQEAQQNLRPKIWSRAGLEKMRLQTLLDGGDGEKFDIPEYEIGSHLTASLAYDFPAAMRSINREELENWGTTYYEALEIARENLDGAGMTFAKIGDGCYASVTGDSYDASRLLVPSLIEKFEVEGDLIAVVPNRDMLLVCGSEDDDGLQVVLDLTKGAIEESRPLVPIPLRLVDDEWVDWFPPPGHPTYRGFHELALRFLYQEYAEQKDLLDKLHEKDGTDIFVASYTAAEKDDRVLTYAVWTNGVETLLPRAEWILFGSLDDLDEKGLAAMASWEKVEQVVGHLLQTTNHYPERFQTTGFPTPDEIEELGMAEL